MRLICPNCSAQYEIDVTLIPDEGRDVQCSNCGHTWFELPPATAETDVAPAIDEDTAAGEPDDEDGGDALADDGSDGSDAFQDDDPTNDLDEDSFDDDGPSPAAAAIAAASESTVEEDADEFYGGGARAPEPSQPRRPADAADIGILREEAERELSQRRAPPTTEPIETQADLGLDTVRDRRTPTRALRARMAHFGEDEAAAEDEPTDIGTRPGSQADVISEADYQAPRRDLLPDIDEINSTLKSRKRASARDGAPGEGKSGFRAGFILMIFVAAALILTYAQAPAIARAVPASEPALLSYVDTANGLRDWIDGMIGRQ